MDRNHLERVNNLMGKMRRLEAAVTAIIYHGGDPILHVRKGNNDIETGIAVSTHNLLDALKKDIDELWPQLENLGVNRGMPNDRIVTQALEALPDKILDHSTKET
jgi:hypothetical protein